MTADELAVSRVDGPHALLPRLVGSWEGTARTWFRPGELGDESRVCGTIRTVLGGRFALHEYHAAMGQLIVEHEGTLERFTGDGMMIFFNDPTPVPDPQERAVRMARAMRERVDELVRGWRKRGYELDFGVGIAQGYATLGAIGFEGRWDYGAIGTVTNLAARLCGEAQPGQILISRRLHAALEDLVEAVPVGEMALKGFSRAVSVYNVTGLRSA